MVARMLSEIVDGVERPGPVDALEVVGTARPERQPGAGCQGAGDLRDEDLIGLRGGHDPCRLVDRDAADVIADGLHLAGVDAGPDPKPQGAAARPNIQGESDGPRRTIERGQEAIASRLDLAPAMLAD